MKRLIVLTVVLMLMGAATGCRCCDWLWRGAAMPAPASVMYTDPCNPCNPCNPCTTPAAGACSAVTPGPVTYGGAPGP